MEALDKRKQERLIKGIILNMLVFIGCAIYVSTSILPEYTNINAMTDKINTVRSDIDSLKKDGVNKTSFVELLNKL